MHIAIMNEPMTSRSSNDKNCMQNGIRETNSIALNGTALIELL